MARITTIEQLFQSAGSVTQFAASINVNAFTAENWRVTGPPLKYWDKIIAVYDLTPADLYLIRQNCIHSNK